MDARNEQRERFEAYLEKLTSVMGHADRHAPLRGYCTGLLIPGRRKSVEPMAARIEPTNVSSCHQSLHHFVAKSTWSDEAVLGAARDYALPAMQTHGAIDAWIVDDTGIPKKGKHSVGVSNQYCGVLGKNANCQVAVSVSVTNETTSLPVAYRLYLPKSWACDPDRRNRAGVPEAAQFQRKWEIALDLIDEALSHEDVPRGRVTADAGYGDSVGFREGLTERELRYVVGVSKTTSVWRPGEEPLPPAEYSGRGRPPKHVRRTPEHQPVSALDLATGLGEETWHDVEWREGTRGPMTSRFAALRIRPAHRDDRREEPRAVEWLLIEWPPSEKEPTRYWLSTEPDDICLEELVRLAKLRWRVERDYQELKQEIGLDHYEGRGWRGFHHHATLSIAAYAFLVAERARLSPPEDGPIAPVEAPAVPEDFKPRGSPGSR